MEILMDIISYEEISLKKGEVLFKENSIGDHIFLVKSGEMITLKETKGRLLPTGLHKETDFVGAVHGIGGGEYCESAIARTHSILIPLPIDDIEKVVDECPNWIRLLLNIIIERLDHSLKFLSEHKIMEDLSHYDEAYTDEDEALYRKQLKEA
jgi:CRP-like cAMP-binding protein